MDLKTLDEFKKHKEGYLEGDLATAFKVLQEYVQPMTRKEFEMFLIDESKYGDGFSEGFQKYLEDRLHLSDELIFEMETLTIYLYQEIK